MTNQTDQYNELKNKTLKDLSKTYNKFDGEKLENEISLVYLQASREVKLIIENLTKESLQEGVKNEIKELIEDLKEVSEKDLEFIFEDTEYYFQQLEAATKIN